MKQEQIQKQKLPEGWKIKNLGSLVKVRKGKKQEPIYSKPTLDSVPHILVESFDGVYKKFTTSKKGEICTEEDILIIWDGSRYGLVATNLNGYVGSTIGILKSNGEVAKDYLFYFLKLNYDKIRQRQKGSGIPHLDKNYFLDINLPYPTDKIVQEQIVSKLRSQMDLIEMMKKEAEKEQEISENIFESFLKESFDEILKKPIKKIKLLELTKKIGSGSTPKGGYRIYEKNGIPFIRSMNVLMNAFDKEGLSYISKEIDENMKGTRVEKGDVLLNLTGASIGRVCVVPDDVCSANVNQHVSIIRLKKEVNPHFLSYYISRKEFQKNIMSLQSGATRQALTKSLIEDFDIPLIDREIQDILVKKIDRQAEEINIIKQKINNKISAISQLPSAISNEIFGRYEIS